MADALQRARRQLSRRRSLRRWLPAVVVGSLASLGVGSATAWVVPKARIPVTAAGPATLANTKAAAQLARDVDALRQASQALSADDAEIAALPHLAVATQNGQSANRASAPALPSIAPVTVPNLPPAAHATTGASGVP